MIEKNVIVLAETEEQLQGIIRGIESLDKEHQIGIILGVHTKDESHTQDDLNMTTEIIGIMADVTGATVIHTSEKNKPVCKNKEINTLTINVPDDSRLIVMDKIKENYPDIVHKLLT